MGLTDFGKKDVAPSGAAARAPMGSYDPYGDALKNYFGGKMNDINYGVTAGQNAIGLANDYINQQRGSTGADYQNNLDMLNWQRGGLQGDIASAQNNLGLRDQIIGNLQSIYGINDRALANQIAQSFLDQSVQSNILGTNLSQNALDTLQKSQGLQSAGIAGGSMMFPGQQIGQQQISQAGQYAADILNQRFRGVTEGGGLTREGYQINADKEKVGLDNSILGQQMSRNGDADTLRNLNRTGGKLDIQERGLANSRDQALAQLGNQQQVNLQKLDELRNSADAQQRALANELAKWLGYA